MKPPIKVAISGAGGQIGYSLTFRIAAGGCSARSNRQPGPAGSPRPQAPRPGHGDGTEGLRLPAPGGDHHRYRPPGGLPGGRLGRPAGRRACGARGGSVTTCSPSTAGSSSSMARINEAACNARVLVVANPCNTNCFIARSVADDVPAEHWSR